MIQECDCRICSQRPSLRAASAYSGARMGAGSCCGAGVETGSSGVAGVGTGASCTAELVVGSSRGAGVGTGSPGTPEVGAGSFRGAETGASSCRGAESGRGTNAGMGGKIGKESSFFCISVLEADDGHCAFGGAGAPRDNFVDSSSGSCICRCKFDALSARCNAPCDSSNRFCIDEYKLGS